MTLETAINVMKYNKDLLGMSEQWNKWSSNASTVACDIAIEYMQKELDEYNKKFNLEKE